MADPTAHVSKFNTFEVYVNIQSFVIKTSEALVTQSIGMLDLSTGLVEFGDDSSNLTPLGLVTGESQGLNEYLTGDGTRKAITKGDIILVNVSVTGASAITDVGKNVYATDGQTLTLTKPATGVPVGLVVNWRTSTYCDVYMFSLYSGLTVGRLLSKDRVRKSFGTFLCNSFQGTAATTLHTETSYEHYKILSLHALCKGYDNAAVAGSQAIHAEIGGVATTGGVLTIAYTNVDAYTDMGTAVDATAITALNEVHVGDTLTVIMAASGTGFTADTVSAVEIYAIIEPLPGA